MRSPRLIRRYVVVFLVLCLLLHPNYVAANPTGMRSIPQTLLRGAFLRIASDLSGATAFESIKTRVTTTGEDAWTAYRRITAKENGGFFALWTGTSSRIIEGGLVGAVFMLGSSITKAQIRALGGSPSAAALAGGMVGGVAQAIIMTPAGLVFTSLNTGKLRLDGKKETSMSVVKRIFRTEGIAGFYAGSGPMALRQATNWASRAGFTEIARSSLGLAKYGIWGELGSGFLGGLGSCWNTPIETCRVLTQRDVALGIPPKSMKGYWDELIRVDGPTGVFRGITPRAMQAVWQTTFLVVVPNMMGI